VIGGLVGGDEADRDVFDQADLDLARRSRARGIGVDQKRHHHLGVVGGATPAIGSAPRVERGQIEHVDHLDDEAGEVTLGEPLVDARRHQESLLSVARDEVVAYRSLPSFGRGAIVRDSAREKRAFQGFSRQPPNCGNRRFRW